LIWVSQGRPGVRITPMLRLYRLGQHMLITNKGLTRGWYSNRLNWTGRHFAKLLSLIASKYIYGLLIKPYKLIIFTTPPAIYSLLVLLKESILCNLATLSDIFGVDHPNAFDGRFSINYCFWSYNYSTRFIIRTFANLFQPLLSVTPLYPSANWLEREIWDFYGIKFLFHPDLRRILTDYGFRGHPLRKDFPLVGYLELRYDDSFRSIVLEPVELSQDFRFFKFYNPWSSYK
jgi:NADH:ubiquinone oxidoreductase subunit C